MDGTSAVAGPGTGSTPETGGVHIVASRPVRVIGPDAPVAEALRVMRVAGVRHLPVVAEGRCTGLLVDRDAIAAAADGLTVRVGQLARHPVPTVSPDQDAVSVARAVLAGGLDAVLVVDDGALVGIITSTDALTAIANGPDATTR